MNAAPAYSLRCTTQELALLCRRLGATTLLGLPDSELDFAWVATPHLTELENRLQQRSCLQSQGGRVRVAANLLPLLGPIVNPTACLGQGYLDSETSRHLAFYWQPPHLVEIQRANQDSWRIQRLSQVTESWQSVATFWNTPGPAERKPQRVFLPQSVFNLAKTWLDRDQSHEFVKQLAVWRATAEVAGALAAALQDPQAQASLCAFERLSTGWALEGYSYLRGSEGWWRTRPCQRGNEPWIEISEVGSAEAGERACSLLKRMLRV